jgi:hypothetical protein
MPVEPASPSAPESLILPRVIPAGGSKWAHCFAGPVRVTVSDGQIITRPGAVVHPNGEVSEDDPAREQVESDVFPLPAGDEISLGRFLGGPLAASIAAGGGRQFNYCGVRLSLRQTEVLQKLGKAAGYVQLDVPARFRSVISQSPATPPNAAGPHVRALADRLRAPAAARNRRLAILPRRETERFSLTNRASLTAWLRAKKIEVIEPETMPLDATAAALAAASLILLADPGQSGLLSLCAPGAKILEIAPEGWLGANARCLCQIFDLQWIPFLANAPAYPLLAAIPFGARVPLSYDIPIRALAKTLDSETL